MKDNFMSFYRSYGLGVTTTATFILIISLFDSSSFISGAAIGTLIPGVLFIIFGGE